MRRRNAVIVVLIAIVLIAAVAAISATKQPDRNAAAQPAAVASSGSDGTRLGTTISGFDVKDIDGRADRIAAPGRPGAMFFFAGWCASCRAEASARGTLKREFGSRLAITAISPDPTDSASAIRAFKATIGDPPYPFVWNSTGSLGTRFAVRALDTTIIYDRAGKVVFRDAAPTDLQTLRAALKRAGIS